MRPLHALCAPVYIVLACIALAASPAAAEPMVSVPILTTTLAPDDIIGERDLSWSDRPARQVSQTIITKSSELVGMALRRPLRAGSEIRYSDVQKPILVKRGSLVTMVVKTNNMVLTAVGRAQENGSKGDYIRLSNISSNTSVEGVVVSPREVMIISSSRVASLGQ